jgi:hypothetical protein
MFLEDSWRIGERQGTHGQTIQKRNIEHTVLSWIRHKNLLIDKVNVLSTNEQCRGQLNRHVAYLPVDLPSPSHLYPRVRKYSRVILYLPVYLYSPFYLPPLLRAIVTCFSVSALSTCIHLSP